MTVYYARSAAHTIEQVLRQKGTFQATIMMRTRVGRAVYTDTVVGLETHYDSVGEAEVYVLLKDSNEQLRASMIETILLGPGPYPHDASPL